MTILNKLRTQIAGLFFFSILFITPMTLAHSSEVWVSYQGDLRYFFDIEEGENSITLKQFRQEKGEYQEKINQWNFKNVDNAFQYVRENYPNYTQTKKLAPWEVKWTLEDHSFAKSDGKATSIWVASNSWSEVWEERYADWLKENITSDFFQKYNIATDCADALIGFRWIFARINYLPVANILGSTGNIFGHFSMLKAWQGLPTSSNWYDDKLFLTALSYVMDMTSTLTILNGDGYPVKISRNGLLAGTFILTRYNGSGHIRTITENHYDEVSELPLVTYSSTTPREVRSLYRENFVDQAWPKRQLKEVLAFRWPVVSSSRWTLQRKENHADYSEEQFDPDLERSQYSFIQFIISRVNTNYDPYKLVDVAISDIVLALETRKTIVRDGYEYCRSHDCRPGTQGYEDWSTPNRDEKLVKKYSDMESLVKDFDSSFPGLFEKWKNQLSGTHVEIEGRSLDLATIRSLFTRNLASSKPTDPPLRRWGLQ
jgi:hypothetical protein